MKYIRKFINEDYISSYDDEQDTLEDDILNSILGSNHVDFMLDELLPMVKTDFENVAKTDNDTIEVINKIKKDDIYQISSAIDNKILEKTKRKRDYDSTSLRLMTGLSSLYHDTYILLKNLIEVLQYIKDGNRIALVSWYDVSYIKDDLFDKPSSVLGGIRIFRLDEKTNVIEGDNTTLEFIELYISKKLQRIDKDCLEIDSSFIDSFNDTCKRIVDIFKYYNNINNKDDARGLNVFKIVLELNDKNYKHVSFLIDYICLNFYIKMIKNCNIYFRQCSEAIVSKIEENNIPISAFGDAKNSTDIAYMIENHIRKIFNPNALFVKYYNYVHNQVKLISK